MRQLKPASDLTSCLFPVSALGDAQAVAWFVRLNGENVSDRQRMAFNRWLGLDPDHRRSYQAVLTLWQRLAPPD